MPEHFQHYVGLYSSLSGKTRQLKLYLKEKIQRQRDGVLKCTVTFIYKVAPA